MPEEGLEGAQASLPERLPPEGLKGGSGKLNERAVLSRAIKWGSSTVRCSLEVSDGFVFALVHASYVVLQNKQTISSRP